MLKENILRTFLFVVFFSIGAATLTAAILAKDLYRYYYNKSVLKSEEQTLIKLKDLDNDYDMLLKQLEKDPELIKRLGPATFGTKPQKEDTAFPIAKARQLDAAKRALTEKTSQKPVEPDIPNWVTRCNRPVKRVMVFICGSALILISLVCFIPIKQTSERPPDLFEPQ